MKITLIKGFSMLVVGSFFYWLLTSKPMSERTSDLTWLGRHEEGIVGAWGPPDKERDSGNFKVLKYFAPFKAKPIYISVDTDGLIFAVSNEKPNFFCNRSGRQPFWMTRNQYKP